MLRGQDILCISSIDWDFNWQGHQEIMSTLAGQGNRVLFVDNTGVRSLKFQDLSRLRQRFLNWWRGIKGFRQERDNLYVYSPLVLPFPYSRLARWINKIIILRALHRWMRATGFHHPIIWTYLPTALIVDLIDRLDPALVVYYCIADFKQLSPRKKKISNSERMLLNQADVVFVQGEVLRQRCSPHPNIHIFPFGVNIATFGREVRPSPELKSIKGPVIGYVGGLHRHVDISLIERVASEVRGTVVLVGPVQTDIARLKEVDSIVCLGPQPHCKIPSFIRRFDLGIIPYILTEYTETVYPTKLNEYLALGIPVVSTDLPEVRRFNSDHGDVVVVAKDNDAFVKAVQLTVEKGLHIGVERRVEVARQNSWEVRISHMSNHIEKALVVREQSVNSWQESLKDLYRRGRRRLAWGVTAFVITYLLIFNSPLFWLLAEPLKVEEPPQQSNAIVVFGGGVGEGGRPGESTIERARFGAKLYLLGFAPYVVFSSGYNYKSNDSEDMKLVAMSMGVQEKAIILEQKANSAYENVRYVSNIAKKEGWDSILVVSSPYNMRRVKFVFDRWGDNLKVTYTPVSEPKFYDTNSGNRWKQFQAILHEYLGILYYWWNDWI